MKVKISIFCMVAALLLAALACNMPGNDTSQPDTPPQVVIEPTDPAPPTDTTVELGLSRANPYPVGSEVSTPFWDIKVLEFHRGEVAWQAMLAENPNLEPPPPGQEYVLLKIWLRNKNPEPQAQNFGLDEIFVTGDALKVHSDVLIDYPVPEIVFSDIFTAEIFEGWLDILVDSGEKNLILAFDRVDYVEGEAQPREVRYLALEGDTSIQIPSELSGIAANDLGMDLENPAKIGETIIGEDWEVTILEAVTGSAALDIVQQMSDKNDPPEEGMSYAAIRARMRYIGTQDMKAAQPIIFGYALDKTTGGGSTISPPRVNNKHPELFPVMEFYFFPGLESEGWFVLSSPVDQTPPVATMTVGGDFKSSRRYFQISP